MISMENESSPVWLPIQAGDLGQRWEKAYRLAVRFAVGVWHKILPRLTYVG